MCVCVCVCVCVRACVLLKEKYSDIVHGKEDFIQTTVIRALQ